MVRLMLAAGSTQSVIVLQRKRSVRNILRHIDLVGRPHRHATYTSLSPSYAVHSPSKKSVIVAMPCGRHHEGPHGGDNFLTRTLPKVATEMALSVLAYNLTRVMNIVGTKPLMAAIVA